MEDGGCGSPRTEYGGFWMSNSRCDGAYETYGYCSLSLSATYSVSYRTPREVCQTWDDARESLQKQAA